MAKKQPVDEEELKNAISDRYERLNALWRDAEHQLKAFCIPTQVVHVYEKGDTEVKCIAWAYSKVGQRLCHGIANTNEETKEHDFRFVPLLDCCLEQRIAAIPHFMELKSKVVDQAWPAIQLLDKSIALFNSILK